MKKIVGGLVALLAVAVAAIGSREIERERARVVDRETHRAAETARQRTTDELGVHVSDMKLKVENAAANPRLVFALQGNVDARTLKDLWRTEEWWRPWRNEFKVYAAARTGDQLDVVEGIDPADFDCRSLIRRIRARGEAVADVVVGRGWPFAAAGTTVKTAENLTPPVLVLARPIDEAALRRISGKVGGAVLLSNGKASLAEAGTEPQRQSLNKAIGREGESGIYVSLDGAWAAGASPVGQGLWIWTYAGSGAAAHEAASTATTRKRELWAIAGLVAVAALVFGFRRTRDGATATPLTSSGRASTMAGVGTNAPSPGFTGSLGDPAASMVTPAAGQTLAGPSAVQAVAPIPASPRGMEATAIAPQHPDGGSTFGRYRLLDKLGEGGMAEVFTAVTFGAEGFRRKFVVKRLRAELARDPAVVAQFIDEANLGSTLVHSNIVPVFDFGKVGNEYFLAQEYILGRDLARVTARQVQQTGRPLPPRAVMFAMVEVLKALDYAHSRAGENGEALGIVHRDVSPSNVMVSAGGEVKLFDFGIVKAEGRVTKTQSGVVKGNVTFMSPEQARGLAVDARADLFSLGLVMYYCLAGSTLYQGQTTYELLVHAATGPNAQDLAAIHALPEPCAGLLRKALAPQPANRFASAREFIDALEPHVAGGSAELTTLIQRLFSEDLRSEASRFGTASAGGEGFPSGRVSS